MELVLIAIGAFVIADILIRLMLKRIKEKKLRIAREAALASSLRLDFSHEAKTLKRASVDHPQARILCVDDEPVVLDSFRKILVLDGYSVDTVERGSEALALVRSHHYDFVFTDLKMPEMNGLEVTKAVKHLRPDIDVLVITGYATVESAVECMKFGALDYIQKPFTEQELLDLVKKSVFRRQENIKQELKPRVHVSHIADQQILGETEFAIPGGVFISEGHCWVSMDQDGSVKIGLDDFAKKIIGSIDDIEPPNLGMTIQRGQPLFSIKQGERTISFRSPVTGRVAKVNSALKKNVRALDTSPYEKNWICALDSDDLDVELPQLKIGKAAVSFFQDEIDNLIEILQLRRKNGDKQRLTGQHPLPNLEQLERKEWTKLTNRFFAR